jgi:hypothetical protein
MDVAFDRAKDAANRRKHGISLQAAAQFDIVSALFLPYGEVRYNAIGWIGAKLHYLTFTVRGTTPADTTLRAISLRKATKREERLYAEET